MSNIYNDLRNSGQTFLYVFISPSAGLPADIMNKRTAQLAQLSEMYSADQTYTPDEMINIIREGIVATYGKQPETILQIIFDNAVRINKANGITGSYTSEGLTFDPESNQYYDGSGNAFILDNAGTVVTKNGQSTDLAIENPNNIESINVASPSSGSTFWKDVQGVIDWVIGILQKLGIANPSKVNTYAPKPKEWGTVTQAGFGGGLTSYLPYIAAAGIVYYLAISKPSKKAKEPKNKALQQ